VGQDFSVTKQDEAGNTVQEFYSAGIILNVKPTILTEDGFEAIYMEANVEKSDAIPSITSTVINKNMAKTNVVLFNGEETVIAGLIDNDITKERIGVPILKDLPWWVFGLRYIFGYNSTRQANREIVIIIKAEIVQPAKERINQREELREQFRRLKEEFEETNEQLNPDL
jgi:type IV pilus assembly protein PilQ